MEIERVQNWLKSAPKGARFCYHVGHLANDRTRITWDGETQRFSEETVEPVHAIGWLMWKAYCRGKVILFQERTDPKSFCYWASKRRV